MPMVKVLAVYRVSPLLLVMEADDATVVELSLRELRDGGHRVSAVACKDLLDHYQLFTCRATRREGVRPTRSAHQPRPPARD